MRRRKSKKKPIGEINGFVPLTEKDLEYAVEIPVKEIQKNDLEKIEKIEKPGEVKHLTKSKNKSKNKFKSKETIKKTGKQKKEKNSDAFNLKLTKTVRENKENKITKRRKGGYTLIITEKPAAALKIAYALAGGNGENSGSVNKISVQGVPYYELTCGGKRIVVACAVGHLFTLTQKEKNKKSSWPNFDIEWQPNFKVKKQDWSKKYYFVLEKLPN